MVHSLLRTRRALALPLFALMLLGSAASAETSQGSEVPAIPDGLLADVFSHQMIMLRWKALEDESDLFGYIVTVDGSPVGITRDTRFRTRLPEPTTSYRFGVRAANGAHLSEETTVEATTLATPDKLRASAPETLDGKAMPGGEIELTWTAAADTPRVRRYLVTIGGTPVGQTRGTRFRLRRLLPGTDYDIGVFADYGPRWPGPLEATISIRTLGVSVEEPENPATPETPPSPPDTDTDADGEEPTSPFDPVDPSEPPADPEPETGAADPYPDGATGIHPTTGLPTHAPDGTPYCD